MISPCCLVADCFEGGPTIHSLSYSVHQYSTTNTAANTTMTCSGTPGRSPHGHHHRDRERDRERERERISVDLLSESTMKREIDSEDVPLREVDDLKVIEERTEKSSTKQTAKSNSGQSTASTRLMSAEAICRRKYCSDDEWSTDNGFGYGRVLWTEWSRMSRNRFCFGGRLMIGSDFKFFILTNVLILTVTVLMGYAVLPRLPMFGVNRNAISSKMWFIGLAVLLSMTLYSLHRAAFTDPGYLPRGNEPTPPRHQQLKPNGSKFCGTCKIWRPSRAKHCRCSVSIHFPVFWVMFCDFNQNSKIWKISKFLWVSLCRELTQDAMLTMPWSKMERCLNFKCF